MIRHAANFIYIENQYFMGSAFQWANDTNVLCNHTIPVEITTKVRPNLAEFLIQTFLNRL